MLFWNYIRRLNFVLFSLYNKQILCNTHHEGKKKLGNWLISLFLTLLFLPVFYFFFLIGKEEKQNYKEKPLEHPPPKKSNWKVEPDDNGNSLDHIKEGEIEWPKRARLSTTKFASRMIWGKTMLENLPRKESMSRTRNLILFNWPKWPVFIVILFSIYWNISSSSMLTFGIFLSLQVLFFFSKQVYIQ